MDTELCKRLIQYKPLEGTFYSKTSKRLIKPDTKGNLLVTYNGEKSRFNANKVAIFLTDGILPKSNEVIFHRNLEQDDYRYRNLEVIPKKIHSDLVNAYRNLNANLKIIPHPSDAYSYIVQWQELSRRCKKTFGDIVTARRFYMQKQLEYAKILNKHTRFD